MRKVRLASLTYDDHEKHDSDRGYPVRIVCLFVICPELPNIVFILADDMDVSSIETPGNPVFSRLYYL